MTNTHKNPPKKSGSGQILVHSPEQHGLFVNKKSEVKPFEEQVGTFLVKLSKIMSKQLKQKTKITQPFKFLL